MANDKNAVSIWFWVFALFVTRLPCIGTLISIPFALFGESESLKNFFRACLLLDALLVLFFGLMTLLGFSPFLFELARQAVDHLPKYFKGS